MIKSDIVFTRPALSGSFTKVLEIHEIQGFKKERTVTKVPKFLTRRNLAIEQKNLGNRTVYTV